MNENYIDLSDNKHYMLLKEVFSNINIQNIKTILDAGSGKTSLSVLLEIFKDSNVDAIVFYNDDRKFNSIKENIVSNRYNLKELDICKDKINKSYDLVLAHLLLGEATKWGNTCKNLIDKLFEIKSKYFVILDFKEDTSVNYNYLESRIDNIKYKLIYKSEILKKEPQKFKGFVGVTYIAYLIEKI